MKKDIHMWAFILLANTWLAAGGTIPGTWYMAGIYLACGFIVLVVPYKKETEELEKK